MKSIFMTAVFLQSCVTITYICTSVQRWKRALLYVCFREVVLTEEELLDYITKFFGKVAIFLAPSAKLTLVLIKLTLLFQPNEKNSHFSKKIDTFSFPNFHKKGVLICQIIIPSNLYQKYNVNQLGNGTSLKKIPQKSNLWWKNGEVFRVKRGRKFFFHLCVRLLK